MTAPTKLSEINTWVREAGHIIRPHMIRKRKFVQEGEDEEVANEFFDHKFAGNEVKPNKRVWVNVFKHMVVRAYNSVRSDIQGSIRGAVMSYAINHPAKRHISMELIWKCFLRKIDLNDDEELGVFTWFWTELLRKYLEVGHYFVVTAGNWPFVWANAKKY